ncbi:hypothetical protein COB57_05150 [Candidatus Peregrinibacteria bacterium]|nr:MAG: hypothetical protein COB57_05150 [Candidatus Peregrinibacteria bacterium]
MFYFGSYFGALYTLQSLPISVCSVDVIEKERVSVLSIDEITPLSISGKTTGNTLRIITKGEIVDMKAGSDFILNTSAAYKNIHAAVPKNMHFFASKRGKYFYSIKNRSQLEKTSVKNLVFFTNESKAIEAGFLKKKK